MRTQRVIVIYADGLFGEGIARILRSDETLEVFCVQATRTDASEQVRRLRPDAVVLEGDIEQAQLRSIVGGLPPMLFIRVHLGDRSMDVYHAHRVVNARPKELVGIIRHGTTDWRRRRAKVPASGSARLQALRR